MSLIKEVFSATYPNKQEGDFYSAEKGVLSVHGKLCASVSKGLLFALQRSLFWLLYLYLNEAAERLHCGQGLNRYRGKQAASLSF